MNRTAHQNKTVEKSPCDLSSDAIHKIRAQSRQVWSAHSYLMKGCCSHFQPLIENLVVGRSFSAQLGEFVKEFLFSLIQDSWPLGIEELSLMLIPSSFTECMTMVIPASSIKLVVILGVRAKRSKAAVAILRLSSSGRSSRRYRETSSHKVQTRAPHSYAGCK